MKPWIIRLFERGYRPLISIIPPGAPLAPGSRIPRSQLGKIPGYRLPNGTWRGFAWATHVATEQDIHQWAQDGASVGILSAFYPSLDIDVLDEWLAERVEQIAVEVLGPAPRRIGRAPKRLLMYRSGEPFPRLAAVLTYDGERHLVECLGRGKQYVIHGPHPSGSRYTWNEDLTERDPESLAWIDRAKVEAFFVALKEQLEVLDVQVELVGAASTKERANVAQADLLAPSIEALQECVAAIPNTDALFPDRPAYIKMGEAIHAAAGPEQEVEGFEVFADWAARHSKDERIEGNPDTWRRDWAGFQSPHSVGWGWLAELAGQHRFNAGQHEFEADLPPKTQATNHASDGAWEQPIPLHLDDHVEPFPLHALPPVMRRLVESVAASLEVPVDFAAVLLLGAVAGAAQRIYKVRVNQDYWEPLCLYLIVLAASGERKTPAMKAFRRVYDGVQRILRERMRPEIGKAEGKRALLEKQKAQLLSEIGHATKQVSLLEFAESAEELQKRAKAEARLERLRKGVEGVSVEIKNHAIPSEPTLWLVEGTPEATAKLLSEHGSLLVFASEGDMIDVAAGQYSDKSGKLGILLAAYSMDTHTEARMDGNREAVEPRLTIVLIVQPAVVEKMQSVPDFAARGLTPRFLYASPASKVGSRSWELNAEIDDEARNTYERIIGSLFGVKLDGGALGSPRAALDDLPANGADSAGAAAEASEGPLPPQKELRLTPEGLSRFQAYAKWLEPQLVNEDADLSGFATWGSKLPGQMLRLAGVLHVMACMEAGNERPWETPISHETIEHAIAIADYFKAHTLRLFVRRPHSSERVVLDWIVDQKVSEFTARDLFRSKHRRFDEDIGKLHSTLKTLAQLGWIAPCRRFDVRGRPKVSYLVNPYLWREHGLPEPRQEGEDAGNAEGGAARRDVEETANATA